jgi:hypothetical protein
VYKCTHYNMAMVAVLLTKNYGTKSTEAKEEEIKKE